MTDRAAVSAGSSAAQAFVDSHREEISSELFGISELCGEFGIACLAPRDGGSHYKVSHPAMAMKLTIPFKRPIKPVYIRALIGFVETVRQLT